MHLRAMKSAHERRRNSSASPVLALFSGGILGDIAPTILQLLGFEQPDEMGGKSLIEELVE